MADSHTNLQGISNRPASAESFRNAVVCESSLASPGGYRLGTAVMFQLAYGACVLGILLACGPATVLGTVESVVVDAVQFKSTGSLAHVLEEGFEGMEPTVADLDATGTVVGITRMCNVVTSAEHPGPHLVGACLGHAMGSSLAFGTERSELAIQATAASGFTAAHCVGSPRDYLPAVALPCPHSARAVVGGAVQPYESPVPFAFVIECVASTAHGVGQNTV